MEEIKNNVLKILEELCLTTVQDTSCTLMEGLAMDSLRMVMLLLTLEETFDIELDESDMNPFLLLTVEDVIRLVQKYMPQTAPCVEEV